MPRTCFALGPALLLTACSQPPSNAADPVAAAAGPSPEAADRAGRAAAPVRACLVQDGVTVPDRKLRATGTEPFWSAAIEGRCVTYRTPEDQAGARIWTRHIAQGNRWSWNGAIGGKPFELTIAPESGCSDGMSDRHYPFAARLRIGSEDMRGCAEPR